MAFAQAIENELSNQLIETENGALGYAGTGKRLLDFFYKVSSYRSMDENDIIDDFRDAWLEDKTLALRLLFFVGDIRQGLGERRTFRVCLNWLSRRDQKGNDWKPVVKYLKEIAEYNRWDTLVDLHFIGCSPVSEATFDLIKEQLEADLKAVNEKKPASLLAKWMPSINTSSRDAVRKAKELATDLKMTPKTYRQTLAKIRKYLDVTEVKTSANDWTLIDYNTVPSKANLKYRQAFLTHDNERRRAFLEALENKVEGVKINSSTCYPHDIVHNYYNIGMPKNSDHWGYGRLIIRKTDATFEEMWKALPDYVKGNGNTLCVVDGSGSMDTPIGGTTASALEIANALGIYFAEHCQGQFRNRFITFSSSPELVKFSDESTLAEKINIAMKHCECSNTNIKATMNLILNTAKNAKMTQEDMPKNILILSDMEFDMAADATVTEALFEKIKNKFEAAGYKMPRIVFWNLNSRTGAIPLKKNELGVALVSGFSTTIMDMVLAQELDPFRALTAKLNSERYKKFIVE